MFWGLCGSLGASGWPIRVCLTSKSGRCSGDTRRVVETRNGSSRSCERTGRRDASVVSAGPKPHDSGSLANAIGPVAWLSSSTVARVDKVFSGSEAR